MDISCKSCGANNLDGQKYCSQCGVLLACEHCGFTNDAKAQFCGGCGQSIQQQLTKRYEHEPEQDSLLGFPIAEILSDVASEAAEQDHLNLGSPTHLDQDALDELFNV